MITGGIIEPHRETTVYHKKAGEIMRSYQVNPTEEDTKMTNTQFTTALILAVLNILREIEVQILTGATLDDLLRFIRAKVKELSTTSNHS